MEEKLRLLNSGDGFWSPDPKFSDQSGFISAGTLVETMHIDEKKKKMIVVKYI